MMYVGQNLGEVFVNHEARMHMSNEHALPSLIEGHKRSKVLKNLMLFISSISGTLAYQQTKDKYWLIGSSLMFGKKKNYLDLLRKYVRQCIFFLAGIPYGAFIENPVVQRLKFLIFDANSEKAKSLLASWKRIQLGRLALAIGGAVVFYWYARR